jgi:hypothetical protein
MKVNAPRVPSDLAIKLHMANTPQQRFAAFELEASGMLRFAGGQAARFKITTLPVAELTGDQLTEVWALIEQYQLMQAKGSWMPKVQQIEWDVLLRAAGKRRNIHCGDDQIPGIKPLYDLLFKYQAAVRYKIPGIGE